MTPAFAAVSPAGWVVLGVITVCLGTVGLAIVVTVPRQAYRRGHGFWSWLFYQLVGLNPIYPLLLLAVLPNRARMRLREQFAAELDAKLLAARPPAAATVAFPGGSVGDAVTADGPPTSSPTR
jgi:hypothetical protein